MSIWNIDKEKRNIKRLNSDKSVDILIIGGGLTGLNCAYYLMNKKNVCVVDANIIGHGVTLNSTAKINYFQDTIYTKIIKATSYDKAVSYLDSQRYATKLLVDIIKKEKINCNLEKVSSYVFANTKSQINILDSEVKFLRRNNIEVIEDKLPLNIKNLKSYYVSDTYVFNPIKYLEGLYKILTTNKVNIYENSKVLKIKKEKGKYICYLDKYKIIANKVILATHYPYFILPFMMPLRCSIEKSYMIVSKVDVNKKITCISADYPIMSIRYYKNKNDIYKISLSKSHELGYYPNDAYYFDRVKKIFKIKDQDIVLEYSNSDIMTPDSMPYIGELKNNLYIGTGYNTWGMTNSMLASKIITDDILGINNKYKDIFNPNRVTLNTFTKIPVYLYNNTKSYIGSKLVKNKNWYSSNIKFTNINGDNVGIYKDKKGKEHIVYNKCPHLGCSLIFNEKEKTWDCPCHSSRFNIDGKCIKGPSNYDIKYKK